MSLWDKLTHRSSNKKPAPEPAKPGLPEWEMLSDDTLRQNVQKHDTLLVRVFDFAEQTIITDGLGPQFAGGGHKMAFADADKTLLLNARDEMIKLGGSLFAIEPIKLSEEWHQVSPNSIAQVSVQQTGKRTKTLRKTFDFAKERLITEDAGGIASDNSPLSMSDPLLVAEARAELARLKEAVVSPFRTGTNEDVVAPQKASFRKKDRTVAL